ncbi:MAG: ATP-binding protein [Candidatus Omnitrophica bacterium]|nr:ATP-binding protein [Candidatus Omnitrophota bacterium]
MAMKLLRNISQKIEKDFGRKETRVVVGPRQVGKTTILRGIAKHCEAQKIPHVYFNLEVPGHAEHFARPMKAVLEDLTAKGQVVFIDEFHYLPNATKLFKAIFDEYPQVRVYASGSSAIEMHKHLKESLAGRRLLYRVFPLSFEEWLPSRSRVTLPDSLKTAVSGRTHQALRGLLNDFVIFGGMPGLIHEKTADDRKRLLLDLVETYMQKDIKALLREEDILSFNRLLSLLAAQEGGILSEMGLSQTLNYSLRQVRKDIAILQQMFLLTVLKPFFNNRGRELKQTNKTYYFDTGIRNAVLRDFRALDDRDDKGELLEAFVLTEIQKNLGVGQDIYYWRTRRKEEVDFILLQDRKPIPIEVKSRLTDTTVPAGLKAFFQQYSTCRLAVVLNNDIFRQIDFNGRKVVFAPHYYARLMPMLFSFGAGL